jgi:hypothetical protein
MSGRATRSQTKAKAKAKAVAAPKGKPAPVKKTTAKAPPKKEVIPEVDYKEHQLAHLCGKHAFNHIVQEEKLVWAPNKALFINKATQKGVALTSNPKDPEIQINMWSFCRNYGLLLLKEQRDEFVTEEATRLHRQLSKKPSLNDEYYKQENGKYAKDLKDDLEKWEANYKIYGNMTIPKIKEKLNKDYDIDNEMADLEHLADGGIGCTMKGASRGDIPYAMFREVLDMLGYHYEEAAEDNWEERIKPIIDSPDLLGLLINQGRWHYVAVPKYTVKKQCKTPKYTFADSATSEENILSCQTKLQLYKTIAELPPTRMFAIYARGDGAYESVAVKRMKSTRRGTRKAAK